MRAVLLKFLREQKISDGQEAKLSELAKEEGTIYVKAATEVRLGQIVTTKDLDLDFQKGA